MGNSQRFNAKFTSFRQKRGKQQMLQNGANPWEVALCCFPSPQLAHQFAEFLHCLQFDGIRSKKNGRPNHSVEVPSGPRQSALAEQKERVLKQQPKEGDDHWG